ncbi:ribokinase [Leifsonia sp. LS1]|uniref:PfkB family carbohydrate kinase n=1 Tax=Leifsonia sp. LS1 TaxID=2828483 RepID=UPI001CFC815A|nr:PfkB family carbohydrate kinase [Leifsonia sp. LS1]GIT82068.1 ribokinase [Leifsonia sp. LS1]
MRSQVLVVGEALTDILSTPTLVEEIPGGSPANVALGLARLGTATHFLTALGPDARGDAIAARLAAAGVTILPESWSLPATSTAVAEIQADGSARYEFDIRWRLPDRVELPRVHHVHIGSIAAFLSPGADQIEELLAALPSKTTISFDPNIRSDLLGDDHAARERFERIASSADLVKLSDEDAQYLYPTTTLGEAARCIAALGPVVAVTRGAAGSFVLTKEDIIEIEPVPSPVADTIGAGDSYMSALLHMLLASGSLVSAIGSTTDMHAAALFAARAAAVTVSRRGAEPPTAYEV